VNDYPSILLVFAAGLLSFLSPCVLPLIPSYLGILGGARFGEKTASNVPARQQSREAAPRNFPRHRVSPLLVTAAFFVLGFTAVFVVMSIIMSATLLLMGGLSAYIRIAAGIIVIILGLNVLFDFIAALNYEKRFNLMGKHSGLAGAFLAGAAFGAGWTPCIGPVLTGVLFLAGSGGKTGAAALYLAVYSLGLGLPFLLAAAFFDRFLVTAAWFRSKLPIIQKVSGVLLIIMGLLILTGRYSAMNAALQKWQFTYIDWARDKALPFRILADWINWLQQL
jgi:cytochrome c-type biogenesis protein